MIPFLTPFLMARLGARGAKVSCWVLLIVLVLFLLGAAKCKYDGGLIRDHDAAIEASAATADRKADTAAAATRRADDARADTERSQLERIAQDEKPAPVSDARRAYHACLRLQQQARAHDQQSPTRCGLDVPSGASRPRR